MAGNGPEDPVSLSSLNKWGFIVSKQMMRWKQSSSTPNLRRVLLACCLSELVNSYVTRKQSLRQDMIHNRPSNLKVRLNAYDLGLGNAEKKLPQPRIRSDQFVRQSPMNEADAIK